MSQIIPSILEKNFANLEHVSNKFLQLINKQDKPERIEIDICDGEYVRNKTWIPEIKTDPYLPNWDSFDYTAHLMVKNPLDKIDILAAYGFDRVVIHFDTFSEEEWGVIVEKCKKLEIEIYLAIKVDNDLKNFVNFVKNNLQDISGLRIMCIDKIGFQKQEFSDQSLKIMVELREAFPEINICVDGGINLDTIELCKNAGANEFVVGSFLVNSPDIKEDFSALGQFL